MPADGSANPVVRAVPTGAALLPSVDLGGDLPCARCRYNLRGLSIRSACPECALPVKVTILTVVDPLADELRPIDSPRLVATGVLLWSVGALASMVCVWAVEAIRAFSLTYFFDSLVAWRTGMVLGALVSGVGATAFVRPHAGLRPGWQAMAAGAVLLYLPLVLGLWISFDRADALSLRSLLHLEPEALPRHFSLLAVQAIVAIILVLIRPNARALAARSLLMRTGQVDRQTLRVLSLVMLLGMLADVVWMVVGDTPGPLADLARQGAQGLVYVAAVLFTVGLANVLGDSASLRGVILQPPLSLRRIFPSETSP